MIDRHSTPSSVLLDRIAPITQATIRVCELFLDGQTSYGVAFLTWNRLDEELARAKNIDAQIVRDRYANLFS